MHLVYIYYGCMVNYSLRLPDDLYSLIKAAAERDRRSIHAQLLWLVEHALEADGDRGPEFWEGL
jgi:hypothetical protein